MKCRGMGAIKKMKKEIRRKTWNIQYGQYQWHGGNG